VRSLLRIIERESGVCLRIGQADHWMAIYGDMVNAFALAWLTFRWNEFNFECFIITKDEIPVSGLSMPDRTQELLCAYLCVTPLPSFDYTR
jgi:hypothetical protein